MKYSSAVNYKYCYKCYYWYILTFIYYALCGLIYFPSMYFMDEFRDSFN